jgi:serine/threonine-protein kinase
VATASSCHDLVGASHDRTVWLADRVDRPFSQRVALKLVDATGDPDAVQRFARERDILASLDHPSIARLLDASVTAGGQAWIAMAFVEGEPIDVWCDRRRLCAAARVALVEQAARAVAHAHSRLVVHRDLKPSNIMVTADGRVKLLDFGVARLLDERTHATHATHATGATGRAPTLAVALTPEYASPEQLKGEQVTTASDVYQLGVLLYELVTGRRPHEAAPGALGELVRLVFGEDPVPPSTSVATRPADEAGRTRLAAARGTSPRSLSDALRADLDHVILRVLRHDPSERYASADAFADDLERYRLSLPVNARKGATVYRARKFARRHRAAVAVAVLAVVVLAGCAITSTVQARRLAREVERTERVKAFLASLFVVSNPAVSRGEPLTARELLDRGAARIDVELRDKPRTRAELLATLGTIYNTLGLYDKAVPLLGSALDLMRASSIGASHRVQTEMDERGFTGPAAGAATALRRSRTTPRREPRSTAGPVWRAAPGPRHEPSPPRSTSGGAGPVGGGGAASAGGVGAACRAVGWVAGVSMVASSLSLPPIFVGSTFR